MAYLIGTDEAGYGPNLGPLVITATLWHVGEGIQPQSLHEVLASHVCRLPDGPDDVRIAMADSKQLYQAGGGLDLLERGVAAALGICAPTVKTWRQVWAEIAALTAAQLDAVPWHQGFDLPLPCVCDPGEVRRASALLREGLACRGVELIAIRSAAVFPAEFNELLERHGNKSSLLSMCTLELIREMLDRCPAGPVMVTSDKHGGRDRYGPLLQVTFPDYLVEVGSERRDCSVYRWGPPARRVEFRFQAKGEQFLPAALASMVSKYLRELAMQAFNAYWLREVPGLRPTAGYPVDARRFREQISARQNACGILDRALWRSR